MRKIIGTLLASTISMICLSYNPKPLNYNEIEFMRMQPLNQQLIEETSNVSICPVEEVIVQETNEVETISEENRMSNEDIELIALVTMAEAEGECEDGKRLVIDTILNRIESNSFPNTVYDVIYQPHQFSSMWNGRVDRCYVDEYICQLVKEELESRQNYEVIFFMAGRYSDYGTPLLQVENHYFSSAE